MTPSLCLRATPNVRTIHILCFCCVWPSHSHARPGSSNISQFTRHPGQRLPAPVRLPPRALPTPRTTRICARQRTGVSFSAPCCLRLSTSCKLPKTPPERHAASRSRAPCSYARAVCALSRRLRCPRFLWHNVGAHRHMHAVHVRIMFCHNDDACE